MSNMRFKRKSSAVALEVIHAVKKNRKNNLSEDSKTTTGNSGKPSNSVNVVNPEDSEDEIPSPSNRTRSFSVSLPCFTKAESPISAIDDALQTSRVLKHIESVLHREDDKISVDPWEWAYLGSSSICDSLKDESIAQHLSSLRVEHVERLLRPLVQRLMVHPANTGGVFNTPVDVVALQIPNYLNRISHPMDLGTVRSKLHNAQYSTLNACLADVDLVFNNAISFNPPNHHIYKAAKDMKAELVVEKKNLAEKCIKEVSILR